MAYKRRYKDDYYPNCRINKRETAPSLEKLKLLRVNCNYFGNSRSVKKASKESAAQSLEILDKHIYLNIDHRRFRLVRNSPRTILTTIGAITFRRRYYEDLMADRDAEEGHYVCPLDEIMGLPRYSRYSNELRIKAIELAFKNGVWCKTLLCFCFFFCFS